MRVDTYEDGALVVTESAPDDPAAVAGIRRQARMEQVRTKARQVAKGDATFTAAEVQRILAALVLDRLQDDDPDA
jgi:hypothetical protein